MKILRLLYDYVLSWAHHRYGVWALFALAVVESIFFPVPPDILLIGLAIATPKRALHYALVCTVGSVLGGVIGYSIGAFLMDEIGMPIISFYHAETLYESLQFKYDQYGAWVVGVLGFTPIPYKIVTITGGAFKINFVVFVVVSLLSRAGRFFLVGSLVYRFGPNIRIAIEKYFNLFSFLFIALLILGFILAKVIV